MGLDYSIRTYVREENLSKCLHWIKDNTDSDNNSFNVIINNKNYTLHGDGIRFYDSKHQKIDESNFLDKKGNYQDFNAIYFSTNIIFDIDPKIISSVGDWTLEFDGSRLEDFIENFQSCYLGNGKISIGNFEASISKLTNKPIYEIDFRAVTSDMSRILESSHSVRKWLKNISKMSESILTYIDLEHDGRLITYYKGIDLEILIKNSIESHSKSLSNFFVDYFNLELDS